MRSTQRKGDVAVAQAITTFTKMGYDVGVPLTESAAYDLLVDIGDVVKRVQVRYTSSHQVDLRRIHSNSKGYVVKRTRSGAYDWLYVLKSTGEEFLLETCLPGRRSWNPDSSHAIQVSPGGVTERTKVAVLKTAGGQPPVGSNPTPSATPPALRRLSPR
jgi:hypothetical protein